MQLNSNLSFVVAELNTHHFMFRGAGHDRESARQALLNAWRTHRDELLRQYPDRQASVPDEQHLELHFRIYYLEFELNAGYRDGLRLV